MRNLITVVLVVIVAAAGLWARQATGVGGEIKTFDVVASRFEFEPATISVVEGDRVRLRLRSADRTHGLGIKAFRLKTLIPKAGEATVEFVADRAGTFEITCSEYCGTGHSRMKGRLIVLPGRVTSSARAVRRLP